MAEQPILSLSDVGVVYRARRGRGHVTALTDASLDIHPGETIGIVGESGSGKTTLGRVALRLQEPSQGSVAYRGRPVHQLTRQERRQFHREVQVVFQDPGSSLNPRKTVLSSVSTGMRIHGIAPRGQMKERTSEILELVGLTPAARYLDRYPDELSGGQKQRVAFARAVALEPKLIVADEALSALDVSLQAQVLRLMVSLRERLGLSYLFISHDLESVREIADRMLVMQAGRIVESGPPEEIFANPRHPYTRKLLDARLALTVPVPVATAGSSRPPEALVDSREDPGPAVDVTVGDGAEGQSNEDDPRRDSADVPVVAQRERH
jgi:ABC-type glutathione transport system ATPase component